MKTLIKKIGTDKLVSQVEESLPSFILLYDKKFNQLYSELLSDIKGIESCLYAVGLDAGEKLKSFRKIEEIAQGLLEKGVTRKNHILVWGGGSLSDFGGFLASILLRGLSWSVIPTTLLSQVDAAIGGKTAVNSEFGKNLIGSFHLPDFIFYDSSFVISLSDNEIQSGKGEILKYAFLNKDIASSIQNKESLDEIVFKCIKFKENIVENDLNENGLRKLLNLGHTFGHAYESLTGLSHGRCVAWGISFIDKYFGDAKQAGLIKSLCDQLEIELPVEEVSNSDIYNYILKDKKRDGKSIDLILINKESLAEISNISFLKIRETLCV